MRPETPPTLVRNTWIRMTAMSGMFLLSIPLSLFTEWAFLCWAAIPVAGQLTRLLADRLRPVST